VCIVLLFVPCALVFAPVDIPLYLVAGFMYGFGGGFAITYVGYTLGAWVGFFAARALFRDWFVQQTLRNDYITVMRWRAHKRHARSFYAPEQRLAKACEGGSFCAL